MTIRAQRSRQVVVAIGVLLGARAPCARAQTAQFIPIPAAVPGQNIAPLGISNDGHTVVGIAGPQAFRWTAAGGMQLLWPGFAYDASADGSVVVGGTGSLTGSGQVVRWTAAGGPQLLGTGQARAVSADGSVVVGGTTPGTSSPALGQAFRWTAAGGMQFLPPIASGSGTYAYDVSADGAVVVGYGNPGDPFAEAFRWSAATGTVGLGGMPGGPQIDTIATAVSDDGDVIAGFGHGVQLGEPFRATDEGMVGLGILPNMIFSIPNDASGDGAVFVGSLFDAATGFHAMIWDGTNGLRRLQDALSSEYGLTLPGRTLEVANGVSADGRRITGFGTNPLGQREGFLVILPGCYPDCNGDGALTVADFGCFQTKFVVSDPYADCDLNRQFTTADFGCFQTRFVTGCP